MTQVQYIKIQSEQAGMRFDRWFRLFFPQVKHGQLEKLLRKGQIRIDGGRAKTNTRIEVGQSIRIPPLDGVKLTHRKTTSLNVSSKMKKDILKSIIYQDDDVIALNKSSGLAVQGGSKTDLHIDGLLELLKFDSSESPRLVHRLDRDTSGVLLIGRNRKSTSFLTKAFAHHDIRKIYWGLTHGVPRPAQGDINIELIKRPVADGYERVRPLKNNEKGGLKALTRFSVIARAGQKFSWVAFMPLTGRTHQIRAHALALKHPLVGDSKYMNREMIHDNTLPNKLHLHSYSIDFPHPFKGRIKLCAPLTGHMKETWSFLGFDKKDIYDPFPIER